MPGQMGHVQVTIQNIEVIDVNAEDNTLVGKGAVQGANGTYLVRKDAKKKDLAERIVPEPEVEPEEEQTEVQPEAENKEGSKE